MKIQVVVFNVASPQGVEKMTKATPRTPVTISSDLTMQTLMKHIMRRCHGQKFPDGVFELKEKPKPRILRAFVYAVDVADDGTGGIGKEEAQYFTAKEDDFAQDGPFVCLLKRLRKEVDGKETWLQLHVRDGGWQNSRPAEKGAS